MKARVIREWKMNGITHKVGEIMDIPLHSPGGLPMIGDRDAFLLDNGFIEEINESTRWKPLMKQNYYYVGNSGYVHGTTWTDDYFDSDRFKIDNCFQTEEEAEQAAEYLKALAVVRGDATKKFVKGENNWYVYYDTDSDSLESSISRSMLDNGIFGLPYFATSEDARRSIEQHINEWLTIFGIEDGE